MKIKVNGGGARGLGDLARKSLLLLLFSVPKTIMAQDAELTREDLIWNTMGEGTLIIFIFIIFAMIICFFRRMT